MAGAAREHLDAIPQAEGFGPPRFPRNVAQILDELPISVKKVEAILVDITADSGLLTCHQIRASPALARVPLFAIFDESAVAKSRKLLKLASQTASVNHPTELSARLRRAMTPQLQKHSDRLAEKGEPQSGEPASDSAPDDPLTRLANAQASSGKSRARMAPRPPLAIPSSGDSAQHRPSRFIQPPLRARRR